MTIDAVQPRQNPATPHFALGGQTTIGDGAKVKSADAGGATLVTVNRDPFTNVYNVGDSNDVHKPRQLPAARPPMEDIEMDLNSLVAFAQMAFMKSEQGTRHTFMEMAFDEQRNMLDSANKVYDLDIKAAKEDFDAAMATGIGEMAAGAVQVGFSAKAGKDLWSAKSLGSKAKAATTKADELEKALKTNGTKFTEDIGKLEKRQVLAGKIEQSKADIKRLEAEGTKRAESDKQLDDLNARYKKLQEEHRVQDGDEKQASDPRLAAFKKAIEAKQKDIAAQRNPEAIKKDLTTAQKNLAKARADNEALQPATLKAFKKDTEDKIKQLEKEKQDLVNGPEPADPARLRKLDDDIAVNQKKLDDHESVDGLQGQITRKDKAFEEYAEDNQRAIKELREDATTHREDADWNVKASMAWGQMGNAVGQMTNGTGKVIAAFYTFQANMDRAESKLESTQQELHNSNYQLYMNFADQAREAMKGAMDSYATTSQGTQSTLNNMAQHF